MGERKKGSTTLAVTIRAGGVSKTITCDASDDSALLNFRVGVIPGGPIN